MNAITLLRFITTHPLNNDRKLSAVSTFVRWQIRSRMNSQPIVHQFTSKSKLVVQRGMTGATGNIYCGLHEFQDMSFVLHFLRSGDVFADIGANVGSYTVLAAAHVGATTYSFEPSPQTFRKLTANLQINGLDGSVHAFNAAVGSTKGTLRFTTGLDTMNHVAGADEEATEVPVVMLDSALDGRIPALIKIDVEGFETEVLKGAGSTLANPAMKGIIIELNGSGARYGYDENIIHDMLGEAGLTPYEYSPFDRKLVPVTERGRHNTIYLRDLPFVTDRLASAEKFSMFSKKI